MFGEKQGDFIVKERIGGKLVKASSKTTASIDSEELLIETWPELSDDEKEMFTEYWKVSSKIKKIPTDSLVWGFVTLKPSMPTLEITDTEE